jgi:hypothetical protein
MMREKCTERRGCRIASGGIETGAEMRGKGQRGRRNKRDAYIDIEKRLA